MSIGRIGIPNPFRAIENEIERGVEKAKDQVHGTADAVGNFAQWATGTGETNKTYGQDDVQTRQIRDSPGVDRARAAFKENQAEDIAAGKDPELTTLTEFGYKIDTPGEFADSGFDPTEQYVGSFTVEARGLGNGKVEYTVTNNTSFKSFLYGIGPEWERRELGPFGTPMSNVRQSYTWTEDL